ncbi:hypothetical protein GCM10027517_23900 [Phycicoccus ginsengisoli]
MFQLTTFVSLTVAAFVTGYLLKVARLKQFLLLAPAEPPQAPRNLPLIIGLSAAYYMAYGIALLRTYGAATPGDVIQAITHPGAAYFAKFSVYEMQTAEGVRNPAVQILTLFAVGSTPLIPFAILYWRDLKLALRIFAALGLAIYCSFFLFIGTLKGLGDVLIFTLTALLLRSKGGWGRAGKRRASKGSKIVMALLIATFGSYMAFNQAQRIQAVGIQRLFEPNPIVTSIMGPDIGRGVSATLFYPTHGYLGLSYNLGTDFQWTKGLGASRALDSYWGQYFGGQSQVDNTYPARTEVRTGWPQGQFWATIYPWLASDITFPGTIVFMGLLGWWLAKLWFESVFQRDRLSVLLLCQEVLCIAYIPANNQIGTGRPSLIAFVSLLIMYALRRRKPSPARLQIAKPLPSMRLRPPMREIYPRRGPRYR